MAFPFPGSSPDTSLPPFATSTYRLHHLGILVRDLPAALVSYRTLGFTPDEPLDAPAHGIRAALVPLGGGVTLEIFTPIADGPVRASLEKRGEGLHHVAFAVPDLASELCILAARGVRLVDTTPRPGLHGWPVAFLHPSAANGVLIELVQPPMTEEQLS